MSETVTHYEPAPTSTLEAPYAVASRGEDVFNSYGVENEIDFLRRNSHKSPDELRYYLERNHVTFGTEFGAKLPYDEVPGLLDDNRLEVAGFDMLESTRTAARLSEEMAGAETRETHEAEAYARVHDALKSAIQQAEAMGQDVRSVRVVSVSPPKSEHTNYAFAFVFKVTGKLADGTYTFDEEILRYDETFGRLANSRRVYRDMQQAIGQPVYETSLRSDRDFLESPLVYLSNSFADAAIRERIFAISDEDIHFTKEYQTRVTEELQPLINGYTALMLGMARGSLDGADPKVLEQLDELQDTIGQIYHWSKEIYEKMDERRQHSLEQSEVPYVDVRDRRTYMEYRRARDIGRALMIEGGSNCPVVQGKSIFSINKDLSSGKSMSDVANSLTEGGESKKTLCCTCPACKKEVEAEIKNGKIHCPKCKASADWK